MAIEYLPEPPANCGRRLLPQYIDEVANTHPSRTFVSVARTANAADGYTDVSFKTFARAVNSCAWRLEEQIGRSQQYTPLLYFGPLDIRYLIVIFAAAKTGHVVFFSSHRNSLKAHLSLLEKTGCNTVLEPEKAPTILNQILQQRPMRRVPVASLDSFLDPTSTVKDYPFEGTFSELKDQPLIILHTSGSTGIPKPVLVNHGVFASQDAQQLIPFYGAKPTWVDMMRGKRVFIGLPVFHAACLAKLSYSIWGGSTVLLPPAGPLSADVVDAVFTHGNVDGALIAPSLIVDVYRNQAYFQNMMKRISFLAYVGGTLSKPIGDEIAAKMDLITMFGSTETLSHPIEIPESREDWDYISYSKVLGHTFRPVEGGFGEMVIKRNSAFELFQGIFSTFPEKSEYGTSDLYEAHPTKQGLWRFRLRSDDIICFSNAEKLNPITMETLISGHPKVKSAVIGGHGQFQACLLLEPMEHPTTPEETESYLNEIWATVTEANRDCPAHGRIMRDFIMITDPSRPIPRAGKGTVQRAAAYQLYEHEFRSIYNQSDEDEELTPVASNGMVDAPSATVSVAGSSATQATLTVDEVESYVDQYLQQQLPRMMSEILNQALGKAMGQVATNLLQQPQDSFQDEQFSQNPREQHIIGLVNGHLSSKFTHGCPTPDSSEDGHVMPFVSESLHTRPDRLPSPKPQPKPKPNRLRTAKSMAAMNSFANQFAPKTNHINNSLPVEKDANTPNAPYFRDVVNRVLTETTYLSGLTDQANLFDCGLDSVQVPELVKRINKTLGGTRSGHKPIVSQTIYNNPSVDQLVQVLGPA